MEPQLLLRHIVLDPCISCLACVIFLERFACAIDVAISTENNGGAHAAGAAPGVFTCIYLNT
jgi:hypothetical protein